MEHLPSQHVQTIDAVDALEQRARETSNPRQRREHLRSACELLDNTIAQLEKDCPRVKMD